MAWRALLLVFPLALAAGCLNTFEEPAEPPLPHHVRIVTLDVSPARVLSQDILLNVTTTLDNRGGGASDPILLLAKAYSEERGFLIAENATDVGVVPADTTRSVPIHLDVPREGGVRIEVVLYEEALAKERASVTVRNLAGVSPEVLDTGLRISDIDFVVGDVLGDGNGTARARIETNLYVTNEGTTPSEDLQVQVKAREVQTSLIADVAWVQTGRIEPETTVIRTVNLTVPDDYNYVFEIVTWRGQTIVARSEGAVQLAPTFVKRNDTEIVTTNPNIRDFAPPTAPTHAVPTFAPGEAPAPRVPGPELALVAGAIALTAFALRRRA